MLALGLCRGLQELGAAVTLFSPGPVDSSVPNVTADLSSFEHELSLRGDTYIELLKKHPFTFITLARQVQSELIAKAYQMANDDQLDIVHIYTNEEDIALPFASLCSKPVVFTHHDPFNFLVKYKNVFPKYAKLNWISLSYAQRKGMPENTNWVGNVYHGISADGLTPVEQPTNDYVAYLGRIIEPKGVHLAIQAVQLYNQTAAQPLRLKIAGKHYAGHKKDAYWQKQIEPFIDGKMIKHVGFINTQSAKRDFLGNARALLMPSLFEEPFGLVIAEAFACGTPVIGLDSGAIPELIDDGLTGYVVKKVFQEDNTIDEQKTATSLATAVAKSHLLQHSNCRSTYEQRFATERMCRECLDIYLELL